MKFKACWVVHGFTQEEGIDYNKTFAGTGCYETARVLLAMICQKDLETAQVDMNLVYLNVKLNKVVYMEYPYIFEVEYGQACQLILSLYSLKQAAFNWFNTCSDYLTKSTSFKRSDCNQYLYISQCLDGTTFILIYMDNMLIVATSTTLVDTVKSIISNHQSTSDLGLISQYLGMKIDYKQCDCKQYDSKTTSLKSTLTIS